jgi:polyisoprenoid-binding protein YceI
MRHLLLTAVALFATSVMTAGTAIPGIKAGTRTFNLNNAVGMNAIQFVSDAPMEKINGTADGVSGSFKLDPSNLEATKGKVEVKVKSMKTAMAKRDEHMYSDSWLDEAKYPTITFELQSLKDVTVSTNGKQPTVVANAVGTFTLHGVTKPFSAPIVLTYVKESGDSKKRASGDLVALRVTFEVQLKDFNIQGRAGLVGNKVGEKIQVSADLFANG